MKSETKAIIFDAGGVYLEGSFFDFIDKACGVLSIDSAFNTNNENNKIVSNPDFNKGKIAIEKFFEELFDMPISDEQMEKIKNIWIMNWKATDEMIALGVKNCFKNGWFSHFDCLVLSHEVGILKPDERIYKITLDKLNLKDQDCLFVDDLKENLKPAREMGMETILFKSTEQLKKEFNKINIKY
jgi:epoxide hydrolase-like predicted phosphatase